MAIGAKPYERWECPARYTDASELAWCGRARGARTPRMEGVQREMTEPVRVCDVFACVDSTICGSTELGEQAACMDPMNLKVRACAPN